MSCTVIIDLGWGQAGPKERWVFIPACNVLLYCQGRASEGYTAQRRDQGAALSLWYSKTVLIAATHCANLSWYRPAGGLQAIYRLIRLGLTLLGFANYLTDVYLTSICDDARCLRAPLRVTEILQLLSAVQD